MIKKLPALILAACLAMFLTACTAPKQKGTLCRIIFERGHGSMWGNQLYMEICGEELVLARFIPAGSTEFAAAEHLPITGETWRALSDMIQLLDPQAERTSLWQRLWKSEKLDGGEYRKLILQWQTDSGIKEVNCKWPAGEQAERFERLLESLLPENVED